MAVLKRIFPRLHQFVLTSDVYIVAPGGIGTVLETMMIWQLLQVHHLRDTPFILVGRMWPAMVGWARTAMLSYDPPLTNVEDFDIPQCVPGPMKPLPSFGTFMIHPMPHFPSRKSWVS